MSTKIAQRSTHPNLNRKRKSCFEITKVAFQTHSDEESGDDEDANVGSDCSKSAVDDDQSVCCGSCNGHSTVGDKSGTDDISIKTRFKVFRSSHTKGRWNCNDFFESDDSEHSDSKETEEHHSTHRDNELADQISNSSVPVEQFDGTTDPSATSPCLSRPIEPSSDGCSHLTPACNSTFCNLSTYNENKERECCDIKERHNNSETDLNLRGGISEVIRNSCNAEQLSCQLNFLSKEQSIIEQLPKRINGLVGPGKDIVTPNSTENISDKISKALDLAKEHVILTAHEEIERLKEKINQLQSIIKHLEEENQELRGSNVQHLPRETPVVVGDLIDLSDT